jgi:hypothetical protein
MKLLYCQVCGDVRALALEDRRCACGASAGCYLEDQLHAEIEGPCYALGFGNRSFHEAKELQVNWQETVRGPWFEAWVIPEGSSRVRRRDV